LSFYAAADPEAALTSWWWPTLAVVGVALAALCVTVLPTRTVGAVAAGLAAVGLLVYFYLGLAVIAKVYSGAPPVPTGATPYFASPLLLLAALIPLGLGLTGFEVASVVSGRLRSVGVPLGIALAAITGCAVTLLLAANVATADGFQYRVSSIATLLSEYFGTQSNVWQLAAFVPLSCAAALALMWAVTRVAGRVFGPAATPRMLVTVTVGGLAVVLCRFQLEVGGLLTIVAALLLLAVYLIVTEANSRVPGSTVAVQGPRAVLAATTVGVVLISLAARDFSGPAWSPVGVTVLLLAVAAAFSVRGTASVHR
jgi:hypothetical protein